MRRSYLILLSVLLASCGVFDKSEEPKEGKVKISTGDITPDSYAPGGMGTSLPGNGESISDKKKRELLELTPESDVAYTDPDNPNADIKEINDAFKRKKQTTMLWGQSYDNALREARRSGKGVLIWFHDSELSPPSKLLSGELLSKPDFLAWAKDNLVLLSYDRHAKHKVEKRLNQYGIPMTPESIKTSKENYVDRMFERFNIRGAPTIVILSADGQKVDSWLGYKKGTHQFVLDKIKNDVRIAQEKFSNFQKNLVPQGYREWQGRNGNTVFAKFTRYDEKKSDVWLREFDGTQTKTKLASLISQDQQWVLDEMQKRKKSKNTSL